MHNNYYKFLFTLPATRTIGKITISPRLTLVFSFGLVTAVFTILSILAATNSDLLPDGRYSYDEADYIYAAGKGFITNYFDKGSIAMSTFISKGLKAGFAREEWVQLSKFIRQSDDISFYRHYHGPLYFYWLGAMKSLGFASEKQVRYSSFLLLLFFAFLFTAMIRALFPQQLLLILLVPLLLVLLGPSFLLTFNHITPHSLYTVVSFACLGCAALYARSGDERYWYGSVICASLAFITIEYSILLLLTLAATLCLARKKHLVILSIKERWRFALLTLVCFMAPLLLLWPGGAGKMTIVKNYLFYAYFTLVRGETYSPFSVLQIWLLRLRESPVEIGIVLCSLVAIPFLVKKNPWLLPFGLYALLLLAGGIRNTSPFPQYIASVFPAAYVLALAGLSTLLDTKDNLFKTLLPIPIVASIVLNCYIFFDTHASTSWQRMPYQITSLESLRPLISGTSMPVFISRDYIPAIHYYFPNARLNSFDLRHEDLAKVSARVANTLRDRNRSALVFFDRKDPSHLALQKHAMTIERETELYLSDQAPHAVCYQVSRAP